MNKDYNNVTFRQLFSVAFLTIPPVAFSIFLYTFTKYEENNTILSLFLMGIYALVYVIILYIVVGKLQKKGLFALNEEKYDDLKKEGNKFVELVYVTRFTVRMIILLYVFGEGVQMLMLPDYNRYLIIIPMLIALFYISGKSYRGILCLCEAVMWFALAIFFFIMLCSIRLMNPDNVVGFLKWGFQGQTCLNIASTMARAYLMLIGFSMTEILMFIYLEIKNRKRKMLLASIGVPSVIGLAASIIVICLLGKNALFLRERQILNIVGAMTITEKTAARIGILACYLFVIYGMVLLAIHFIFAVNSLKRSIGVPIVASETIQEAETEDTDKSNASDEGKSPKSSKNKRGFFEIFGKNTISVFYAVFILILYICAGILFQKINVANFAVAYMAAVDIPLSILVPALFVRGKSHPEGFMKGIFALLLICVVIPAFLTGCNYESVENVDYLRVVIVEDAGAENYNFTLISDSIKGADTSGDVSEKSYSFQGATLKEAIDNYNTEHDKKLDYSHTEYIVTDYADTVDNMYLELMDIFPINYVEVIVMEDMQADSLRRMDDLDKYIREGNLRSYLKSQYNGECLATYDLSK